MPVTVSRGNVALLEDPVAQELLQSDIPARLAYIGRDGKPRVVPVWSEWNGHDIVIVTPSTSAKLKSLAQNPHVALTIDRNSFPWHVLLVRGTAHIETVDGLAPEFERFARRYMGEEAGRGFCEMYAGMVSRMPEPKSARIIITPEWVSVNDFETRFPPQIAPYLPD
ncbi:MAG: pyridoxamine 5'-phosphate oxidase family protein [Chloroflexi bacterium]|nr:pyridoxamine 5'-phosphate oxidase family protein [Chloroflexota bacterium]